MQMQKEEGRRKKVETDFEVGLDLLRQAAFGVNDA